ncbi:DUF6869 domain-containing protein [Arenimonas oryziterrae]|uniref:DUF6869 domain-containing protein n=1 Tax=Arenimonas oryziterrae DSM 21050 = YC6267 TaxID=1121015 RepID=A0A091AUF2_9GAMM|nr:hypothetical protein [Arenimonas oryziterrae]KFN43016.1 hypothetical protein N789_10670 [Arenimonas oryziterrae DSM 21050 = YC6267]
MSERSTEIEAWAMAYIELYESGAPVNEKHALWWAAEQFMLPEDEAAAEKSWETILAIVARNPSGTVLSVLAAGPLEDLIHYFGPLFVSRIEQQARSDQTFRDLLGGVWESGQPDIWKRVAASRGPIW